MYMRSWKPPKPVSINLVKWVALPIKISSFPDSPPHAYESGTETKCYQLHVTDMFEGNLKKKKKKKKETYLFSEIIEPSSAYHVSLYLHVPFPPSSVRVISTSLYPSTYVIKSSTIWISYLVNLLIWTSNTNKETKQSKGRLEIDLK